VCAKILRSACGLGFECGSGGSSVLVDHGSGFSMARRTARVRSPEGMAGRPGGRRWPARCDRWRTGHVGRFPETPGPARSRHPLLGVLSEQGPSGVRRTPSGQLSAPLRTVGPHPPDHDFRL
jgi:hypothetical protein